MLYRKYFNAHPMNLFNSPSWTGCMQTDCLSSVLMLSPETIRGYRKRLHTKYFPWWLFACAITVEVVYGLPGCDLRVKALITIIKISKPTNSNVYTCFVTYLDKWKTIKAFVFFCVYICECRWLSSTSTPCARFPARHSRPNSLFCAVITDVYQTISWSEVKSM